ncbi:MAG: hypothetical protein IKC01_06985 [Clostridia bacterium]|nr:hypothetical protein [Clostridia bacterium]
MIKKFMDAKHIFNSLGANTKFFVRVTLTTVITCFFAAIICFIMKDNSQNYTFFYNVAEELLIVTRSCSFLGLFMLYLFLKIEKR